MKRLALILAGILVGAGIMLGMPASASSGGGYPTPTATPTQPLPTVTPTPTQPTPTPTVPVVNPFANCAFSFSFATTFDPIRGRFIRRFVPAIVCDHGRRGVSVYDLVR